MTTASTPIDASAAAWPITLDDVRAARERLRHHLEPTPLRHHPALDQAVGAGIRVLVKHENFLPTNSFKVRNGLSVVSALSPADRARGVVAATRGNYGLGIAYAGRLLGAPVTIIVPHGNNPEKNEGMRAYGAELVVEGRDFDDAMAAAEQVARERGACLAHSANDVAVLAGAATMSLEIVEQAPVLDAVIVSVGAGSQAVGALTVARALRPGLAVYAVQAAGASVAHDSWHAGRPLPPRPPDTIADGLATRGTYEMTFPALRAGLADFVTVTDAEIAEAMRLLLRTTHSLVEGGGAAATAALLKMRDRLAGQRVAVVISGGNVDAETLRRVLAREL